MFPITYDNKVVRAII